MQGDQLIDWSVKNVTLLRLLDHELKIELLLSLLNCGDLVCEGLGILLVLKVCHSRLPMV